MASHAALLLAETLGRDAQQGGHRDQVRDTARRGPGGPGRGVRAQRARHEREGRARCDGSEYFPQAVYKRYRCLDRHKVTLHATHTQKHTHTHRLSTKGTAVLTATRSPCMQHTTMQHHADKMTSMLLHPAPMQGIRHAVSSTYKDSYMQLCCAPALCVPC